MCFHQFKVFKSKSISEKGLQKKKGINGTKYGVEQLKRGYMATSRGEWYSSQTG
jgi:hypothetical protein